MSLSCPDPKPGARLLGLAFATALAGGWLPMAEAAQTYFEPRIEGRVEQNTNRNLSIDPATEQDILGYVVIAEAIWGYLSPTTDTRIRPRIRLQEYPDNKEVRRSEEFLDLTMRHRPTERTTLGLAGHYSRRDDFNAQLGEAEFDELDPDDPTEISDTGTATVLTEDTRTRTHVRPQYTHRFTERAGVGLAALYQTVRFDSETRTASSDYDYWQVDAFSTYRLDPRTTLSLGPYVAGYETGDDSNRTDSLGLSAGWDRTWDELFETRFRIYGERSEVELRDGGAITSTDKDTYVGADFTADRRMETGRLRFTAGRKFYPTSDGNRTVTDELRVQYDMNISARLSMRTALRAYQREAQGRTASGDDRDYARGELSIRWMLTPQYFVGGGYEYTWQERGQEGTSANNHAAFINFGYRGLGPRR
jgi:hypothetical protein